MDRCSAQNSWFIRALAEGDVQLENGTMENLASQLGIQTSGAGLFCVCVGFLETASLENDAMLPLTLMRACRRVGKGIPGYLVSYLGSNLCVVTVFSENTQKQTKSCGEVFSIIADEIAKKENL